ncbi:MAG TPA: glycosyltransferase family A protein [Dongiaceae bacterium]|nr:glycosyltransferase family A protein [Dongiaceae bacterium]
MTKMIACIIPTHGRPDFLAAALDSVLSQTLAPAEVAVVDDLDDAQTAAMVAAAAGRAPFPVRHIVNLSNPGASGSRNAGATASTAPVLAFLDDDDAWRPDYLAQASAALQRSGADAVISGLTRYRQDGGIQKIVMPPLHAIAGRLYEKNFGMTGSNLVITRTAFDWAGRFDPALPVFNDWDFLIRMVGAGVTYTVVEELLVEWREHMGDRISTPTLRRAIGIEAFVAKHQAALPPLHRRNLMADALGIRRRNAESLFGRAVLAAQLLRLLGFREAIGRRLRPARDNARAGMLEAGR